MVDAHNPTSMALTMGSSNHINDCAAHASVVVRLRARSADTLLYAALTCVIRT